jgi:V/A-type H+-transporting ATPase subunit D
MPKISLNKGALAKERDRLKLYRKVLPSLDLKRMQLTAEFKKAKARLLIAEDDLADKRDELGKKIPMLANREIHLAGLVRMTEVQIDEENVVGVRLPVLGELSFEVLPYSMMAKPHWVDATVEAVKKLVTLTFVVRIARERVDRLDHAVRRITQRVNLFEKILIPRAQKNIQRIQIFLGDAERSAIVRSKIAKAMRVKKRLAFLEEIS